jgi:hypothetical protein
MLASIAEDLRGVSIILRIGLTPMDARCSVGSDEGAVTMEILPHIHLIFSNLKTWLLSTHHGSVQKQHMQAPGHASLRPSRRCSGLIDERLGPTYAGLYGIAKGSQEWAHPTPTRGARGSQPDT